MASGGNFVATRRRFTQEYKDQAVSLRPPEMRRVVESKQSMIV